MKLGHVKNLSGTVWEVFASGEGVKIYLQGEYMAPEAAEALARLLLDAARTSREMR